MAIRVVEKGIYIGVEEAGIAIRTLLDVVAKVRALHYEFSDSEDCAECGHIYPCPTVEALEGKSHGK